MRVFVWTLALTVVTFCVATGAPRALAQVDPEEGDLGTPSTPAEPAEPPPVEAPVWPPPMPAGATAAPVQESACDGGVDEDGDGLTDCADADCYDNPRCQAGGGEERSGAACSDWVDNDGDEAVDCDDQDCVTAGVAHCSGSWTRDGAGAANAGGSEDLPELAEGMTVEDLIGRGGDADGERTDEECSDGIDNDHDGRADCADFGCRFDRTVSVCQTVTGLRFGVVAAVGGAYDLERSGAAAADVRFTRLQLRALGPIPGIERSFFIVIANVERTPRVPFALFQVPVSNAGHYFNVNSGSGGLSTGFLIRGWKQPLLDPPWYFYRAFEQGSGASFELGGPVDSDGVFGLRGFVAAGSGEFNGSVGGRFFRNDDRNFTWASGLQLQYNIIGRFHRNDSLMMYTPVPTTAGILLGGKFDQRAVERYAAGNLFALYRYSHFQLRAENYTRYVLDYDGVQTAWNVQAGVLLVPKLLFAAADIGGFEPLRDYCVQQEDGSCAEPTDDLYSASFRNPLRELEWRVALHMYLFRNTASVAILYRDWRKDFDAGRPDDVTREREIRLEGRVHF